MNLPELDPPELDLPELKLPERSSPPPLVSPDHPVEQVTQPAPTHLQEELLQVLETLPGVEIRPSLICVPGTRAGHLTPTLAHGPLQAFLAGTEFAHLHPVYDGSLHVMLPPSAVEAVVTGGWGIPAGPAGSVLVYGPRDDAEAEVARQLLLAAYRYACTEPRGGRPS
ncbi:luciferase family protein [Streptacidiphilus sp. MAP5-3]|uniref:luciferase domain-containing protein n=1 Tax=unclassified Streptacidiphilus TaxID=2643834 RepID=UPI0035122843